MHNPPLFPLLVASLFNPSLQLFPGAEPDEGDYRHLYPIVCIALYARESYGHTLPYTFGLVEGLRYPKDRLNLIFYEDDAVSRGAGIQDENNNSNGASSLIERWLQSVSSFYRSTSFVQLEVDENWRESALKFGRRKSCSYLLLTNGDSFLLENSLKQLIDLNEVAVSPLLNGPFKHGSNHDGLMGEDFIGRERVGSLRVYYTYEPILINLKHKDASYLTYDQDNLADYQGSGHPLNVFAFSAYSMGIIIVVNNAHFYGYHLSSHSMTPSRHKETLATFIANLISNHGSLPFLPSIVESLHPVNPPPTKFGFDEIYLINLQRRPERLRKMKKILELLGIAYRRFDAVDGMDAEQLIEFPQIQFLPNYLDPFHQRPMKKGEIGCFLSHYKIWEEMLENEYDRVIVLEDDLRFTENSTIMLREVVEDVMKTQLEWDMIYLGRKKMSAPGEEFFVPGHRYLSTIGYSYWTLGYALSRGGAQKLMQAKPLEKLVALDEFLPIMYDKHPNMEWKAQFESRNLKAYTVYPVIVEPERYTFDPDYVSDTEGSQLAGGSVLTNTTLNDDSANMETERKINLHHDLGATAKDAHGEL